MSFKILINKYTIQLDYLIAIGYTSCAAETLLSFNEIGFSCMNDVHFLIKHFGYYKLNPGEIYNRTISQAIDGGSITCLEAALIAYDLASMLKNDTRIMTMTRFDPKENTYLGHAALIYRANNSLFSAIAISRHTAQGERHARYLTEEMVVLSYAETYIELGLVPICFGISDIYTFTLDLDWRRSVSAMQKLHASLLKAQTNYFEITKTKTRNTNHV